MGIFVTKGMGLRVPPGGLVIGPEASTLTLHVSLDVWPYWLSLATRHARDAELARSALIAAGEDASARQTALEAEFSAGMQAAVCAAVAVDAFFAVVKDKSDFPHALTLTWRKKKTGRFRQVAEVLRRAFKIGPKTSASVRILLRELFQLRDRAVHPDAAFSHPMHHPVLGVATEWRFVVFRHENAKAMVGNALTLISRLLALPNPKYPALVTWSKAALHLVGGPLAEWEAGFGPLASR